MRAALIELVGKIGTVEAVADAAGLSSENLKQVIRGYLLPKTKRPRGLGPASRRALDAAFPDWMHTQTQPLGSGGVPPLAHQVSLETVTVVPFIQWKQLMTQPLPAVFKVVLPDNSMFPKAPAGTAVEFSAGIQPMPGDGILIRDRSNNVYFREYRESRPGVWVAFAANGAYAPLEAERDGLEIMAVLTGVSARWSL